MRYKINKHALFSRMEEFDQNSLQKFNYLKHTISCLMSSKDWDLFNTLAYAYHIYSMMLQKAFELIRLKFSDYLVIVQSTEHEFIIEIRKISVK